jgi:hypothetical protein
MDKETQPSKLNCHFDRSAAEWRDLQFCVSFIV